MLGQHVFPERLAEPDCPYGTSRAVEDFEEFVKKCQAAMLSRTAEPPHAPAPAFSAPHSGGHVNLGDGVGFELGIVGESHYVPELQEIAKRRKAASYRPVFRAVTAQGGVAQCRAKLFGGTLEKPNIGVWLDIDPPDELLRRLTASVSDQPF